jgi:hypothetical protein
MQAATEREVDHPRPGERGAWAWRRENARRGAQGGAEASREAASTHDRRRDRQGVTEADCGQPVCKCSLPAGGNRRNGRAHDGT